jgi:ketosteroid isomerase-like protein
MAEQDNTQKVQELYAAFGRGDVPAVLDMLADDVEWVLAGPPDIPMTGTRRGKAAVGEWFGIAAENLDFRKFAPRAFIAQGDTVVALIDVEAVARRTGRTFASHDAHVYTFKDGKVSRQESYEDTAAVVAAYRGE